jgi:hypothetical protein
VSCFLAVAGATSVRAPSDHVNNWDRWLIPDHDDYGSG